MKSSFLRHIRLGQVQILLQFYCQWLASPRSDWAQIGVSHLATFVDSTAALVAGQPETREYRAHGMVANARTGDLSPTVSVVTTP